jgi:hypothetical protein
MRLSRNVLLLPVLVFAIASTASTASAAPPTRPTSSWTMDNTLADAQGFANCGVVNGAESYVRWHRHGMDTGFQFDGTIGLGCGAPFVGSNTVGNFGTADFKVSFWMRTTQVAVAAIIDKRVQCMALPAFWSIRMGTTGQLQAEVSDGVRIPANGAVPNYQAMVSTTAVNDGASHKVEFQRVGTLVTLAIDGAVEATITVPADLNISIPPAIDVPLRMGWDSCTYADATIPFVGILDEIRIY